MSPPTPTPPPPAPPSEPPASPARAEQPEHRLNVRLAFGIFAACLTTFIVITSIDVLTSAIAWRDYHGGAVMARTFATTVSRAYNVILSMVVASIALAIPITANMYTPKLVEIFVKDKYTVSVIAFFVFSCTHAIWASFVTWDGPAGTAGFWPHVNMYLLLVEMLFGFSIMIPYLSYASGFLNPSIIIKRVSDQILDELADIERRVRPLQVAQHRLAQKILHLGNVILRAVDRADRDVALEAIRALKGVILRYQTMERRLPAAWFDVSSDIMVGSSSDAIAFAKAERNWVEHRCMTQLALAYNAALAKMPDAVSSISDVVRELAIEAQKLGDRTALLLMIRFLNTFVREAVKKKDVHAIYDILYQYKALVREIMTKEPDLVLDCGRYFKYYAEFARASGMPFIYELTSYELGEILEWAFERGLATREALLDLTLTLEGVAASARLVKSRAILWAFFTGRKLAAEAERVRQSLRAVPVPTLETARADLLGTTERMFWEVTDRQANFDYVDDARKALVRELLDGLIRDAMPPLAPKPVPVKVA